MKFSQCRYPIRKCVFFLFLLININVSFSQQTKNSIATRLIPVLVNNKFGFCDTSGKMIIKPIYKDADPFVKFYTYVNDINVVGFRAMVKLKNTQFFIDTLGAIIKKVEEDDLMSIMQYNEPMFEVVENDGKKGLALKRRNITVIIKCIYDKIQHPDFYDSGLPFVVKRGEKFGLCNIATNITTKIAYDEVFMDYFKFFDSHLIKVRRGKQVFFVDYAGKEYLK